MKKFFLFFILSAVLVTGCSDDKPSRVYSLYDVGCSHTFSNLELGKNPSVSGIYENAIITQLNCNSDVYVTIDFYDSYYSGHYKYFLVNGYNPTYSETLYRDFLGVSSGAYTFTTDSTIYEYGDYYGLYRVTVQNLETGEYASEDFSIAAYENGPYSKAEPAISKLDARFAPEIQVNTNDNKSTGISKDNNSLNNIDNITK